MKDSRLLAVVGSFCVSLFAFGGARADIAKMDSAYRLVATMRADEITLRSLQATDPRDGAGRPWPPEQAQCLKRIRILELAPYIAIHVADSLSADDISAAIAFYQSLAGREWIKTQYANAALASDQSLDGIPEASRRSIARFKNSPAGRRILASLDSFQRVYKSKLVTTLNLQLRDCAEDVRSHIESCESLPVASPNNRCTAKYGILAHATKTQETEVSVDCDKNLPNSSFIHYRFDGAERDVNFR